MRGADVDAAQALADIAAIAIRPHRATCEAQVNKSTRYGFARPECPAASWVAGHSTSRGPFRRAFQPVDTYWRGLLF